MKIRTILRHILTPIPGGEWLMDLWRKERWSLQTWLKRRRLQKCGLEILQKVGQTLTRHPKAVYHADYGTLLGIVRENGFIRHDDDIDFSVYDGTITPHDLYSAMIGEGFAFLRGFRYGGVVTELAFVYKKVSVDFFYVYNSAKGNYSQVYNDFRSDKDCDRAYFAERLAKPRLSRIETFYMKGVKVNVPENKVEFLKYAYGSGWAVPVKTWKREDGDLAKRKVLPGCAEIFHSL